MDYVKIKGKKFKVTKPRKFDKEIIDRYSRDYIDMYKGYRLLLDDQDINDINEIEGLKSLTSFKTLQKDGGNLRLDANQIKEIKGLENLENLKTLNLNVNRITKIEGLETLENLEGLYLSSNRIKKIEGLEALKNLEILYLKTNHIEKIEGLENLPKLKYLYLDGNDITKLEGLEQLHELEELTINSAFPKGKPKQDPKITKIEGLENLTKLKLLNLADNDIEEITGLENCKSLETLTLSRNNISEIKGLTKLYNLTNLNLNENRIKEIKGLENLENLIALKLEENQITEIKGLEYLSELTHLWLNGNPNLKELKGLNRLKRLSKLGIGNTAIPHNLIQSLGGTDNNYDANEPQKFVKYCQEMLRKKEREVVRRPSKREEIFSESLADSIHIPLPFKAYKGTEPFVFTSYAHSDKQHVYPIIKSLNKDGINIWYDQGIEISENWKKSIAENLNQCTAFLVFISPNIIESEFVRKEIDFALRKKKHFIGVYLQETELPIELDFDLPAIQALLKYLIPETEFYEQLRETLQKKLNE